MSVTRRTVHKAEQHGASHRGRQRLALAMVVLFGLAMTSMGCHDDDDRVVMVDVTPPAIPAGVSSITADEEIILYWLPNREPDLAGYRIWWSDDNVDFGREPLADIDAWDPLNYDAGSGEGDDFMIYSDLGIPNGSENFYAVTAYDFAGNESDLSLEYVRDVPRPEGFVILGANDLFPSTSGFDFSRFARQADDLVSTDVWYEVDGNNVGWFVLPDPLAVNRLVSVQDYGPVGFDALSYGPQDGYSRLDRVEVIAGHSYAFEIVSDLGGLDIVNYAKFYVDSANANEVALFWGYQEVPGEEQLKGEPTHRTLPITRAMEWIKRKAEQS